SPAPISTLSLHDALPIWMPRRGTIWLATLLWLLRRAITAPGGALLDSGVHVRIRGQCARWSRPVHFCSWGRRWVWWSFASPRPFRHQTSSIFFIVHTWSRRET